MGKMKLDIVGRKGEADSMALARSELDPLAGNAGLVRTFSHAGGDDITALHQAIAKSAEAVCSGDLSEPEAMLMAQAHSLNTLFTALAQRAAANMGEYMQATETYLRMALKAQSQCRATLETLAEIKNPRSVTITRQANIAGQQVVNNGNMVTGGNSSHAGRKQNPENELLGDVHNERLDTGTAQTAGGTYQDVETVGTINGGANRGRKSQKRPQ